MHCRTPHCLFLILLLLVQFTGLPARAQNPASLQIVIVEGEGAINNVKQRVNREPFHWYYMSRNRRRAWGELSKTIVSHARSMPLHPISPTMEYVGSDHYQFRS